MLYSKPDLHHAIVQSNMPSSEKSYLTQILSEAVKPIAPIQPEKTRGDMLIELLQAGGVGGGLGVLHAELKDGLDVNGIPIDLGLAIISSIGGIAYKSATSHEISKQALTVYSFRSTENLLSSIKKRRAENAANTK